MMSAAIHAHAHTAAHAPSRTRRLYFVLGWVSLVGLTLLLVYNA